MAEFGDALEASFAILRREAPKHLELLHASLGDLGIRARVGSTDLWIGRELGSIRVSHEERDARVSATISRTDLDAILQGKLGIEEAVWRNSLEIRGSVDDIRTFYESLRIWIHGMLRSPSSPALLRRFSPQ